MFTVVAVGSTAPEGSDTVAWPITRTFDSTEAMATPFTAAALIASATDGLGVDTMANRELDIPLVHKRDLIDLSKSCNAI